MPTARRRWRFPTVSANIGTMTLALADLAMLAAAPAVGSFIGLVAHRFGTGETVVWGRSHCRACGRSLTAV